MKEIIMISLKIKCEDADSMAKLRDKFCSALCGSPAFVESEIAVCDCIEDESCFFLAVGNDNDCDLDLEIDSTNIINLNIKEK
jgi:hypothetical protein